MSDKTQNATALSGHAAPINKFTGNSGHDRNPNMRPFPAGAGVSAALARRVEAGTLPGIVACAATRNGEIYNGAFGLAEIDSARPMNENALFYIASMTKAVTAVAVMQLVEQGRLSLDEPAAEILPSLAEVKVLDGFQPDGTPRLRSPRSAITIRQLLAHTSGFAHRYWNKDIQRYAEWADIPDSVTYLNRSLELPLASDPGESWHYGISSEFLGKIVEKITGLGLDEYFYEKIFEPLGMADTYYDVPESQRDRVAAVHTRLANGSCASIALTLPENPEFYPGGLGLFSTAADYLKLTRMLLGGGIVGGCRLLSEATVQMIGTNQLGRASMAPMLSCDPFWSHDVDLFPGQEKQWGLGFLLNTRRCASGREALSMSWAGACNTFYWVDRARDVTAVFMTSIVPFCDPAALEAFGAFEQEIYAMLEKL